VSLFETREIGLPPDRRILWHIERMPDEDHRYPNQRPVTVMISAEGIAERLAQLPTCKEMYRACCSERQPAPASRSASLGCSTARVRRKRVTADHLCRHVFLAAMVAAASARTAHGAEVDPAKATCRAFTTSGQANMAVVIMWLRGYHAGKTGPTAYQSSDPYGGRLGYYCAQHPDANLIEASEPILTSLDHGF
jgi:hypothetical protein